MFIGIEHAFHALALDEHRGAFTPTMWYLDKQFGTNCDLRQCWFPGYHADVGGGTTAGKEDKSAIDEVSLAWMCDQVDGLLTFDKKAVEKYLLKSKQNEDSEEVWGSGEIVDPCSLAYSMNIAGGDVLRTPGMYHKNMQSHKKRVNGDFATNETMHPLIRHRMETTHDKYDPPALKEHGGVRYAKSPAWVYEDEGDSGNGATWIRPEVAEKPGKLYGKWPFQRQLLVKEWVIKEEPGKLNAEAMLLPEAIRRRLDQRNRNELTKSKCTLQA